MTPSTLLIRVALPLVLMASVAVAGERESVVRNVLLPAEPVDEARAVHVAGGVATVLRFETPFVKDALKLTPFRHQRTWRLPSDGVEIKIQSYTSLDKTAVRFYVTNQARKTPWRLKEARLMTATSLEARPFALRLDQEEIAPGATGAIAVVLDSSAFESKAAQTGVEQLVLELYRADGMQEVFVVLELEQQNPRK